MEEKEILDVIENGITNSMEKYLKSGAKKLNLYTILQVMWILELYYLGANAIYEFLVVNPQIKEQFNFYTVELPKEIEMYNNIIM